MSFRKELGRFDTAMVVVGGIIGAGIMLPGRGPEAGQATLVAPGPAGTFVFRRRIPLSDRPRGVFATAGVPLFPHSSWEPPS